MEVCVETLFEQQPDRWQLKSHGSSRIEVGLDRSDRQVLVLRGNELIAHDAFGQNVSPIHMALRGLELAFQKGLAVFPWECNLSLLRLWKIGGNGGWQLGFYKAADGSYDGHELDVITLIHGPKGWQSSLLGFMDRTSHPTPEAAFTDVITRFLAHDFFV